MAEAKSSTSTAKSTARSTAKANAETRPPLASAATDAAWVDSWNAWNAAPQDTRGPAPIRPVGRTSDALLLDIATSLRAQLGEPDAATAIQGYADAQAEYEKQTAKVTTVEEKTQAAIAEAEAELQAAKAKAAEDVAKAKGTTLDTDA